MTPHPSLSLRRGKEKGKMAERKCIGCGQLFPRENLIKITKNHDGGNIVINPNSKIFGRSVYLCYNQSCIENAFKKKRINKLLKTNVHIEQAELLKFVKN